MAMTTTVSRMKSSLKNSSISQEIIFDIFSWLPVKSLIRFKCISKEFNSLISDSLFMDIHHCHSRNRTKLLAHKRNPRGGKDFFYTMEQSDDGKSSLLHSEDYFEGIYDIIYMKIDFVVCVNGLFCFWEPGNKLAIVCNPSTREKTILPDISTPLPCYYSLGFEPEEKIYKVLFTKIKYLRASRIASNWIFTLGTGESWKEIESVPEFYLAKRVCFNGVIYMLNGEEHKQYILAFDVKAESFRTIGLWKDLHHYKYHYNLVEVKGKLAVLKSKTINGEITLWILEKGQHEKWERHIIIGFPLVSKKLKCVIKYLTYDEGIIFVVKVECDKYSYFFYDITRKSWKECEIRGLHEKGGMLVTIYSWVESLFKLKKIRQQV